MRDLLGPRGAPVFFAFFIWSLGTGSIHLARPLFAASFDVSLALVALVTSSNAVAHLISGPITGFLVDRFGRKPLLLVGLVLRGGSTFAEFFAQSYLQYLGLEFIGGLGVAVWMTGSTVLLADMSQGQNRARAVALRTMSSRLGFIAGPIIGALIATAWDLRAVFLFNAFTKALLLIIVGKLIAETRPAPEVADPHGHTAGAGPSQQLSLSMFLTRPFFIIAGTAFAVSMMQQGVFSALFPVYLKSISTLGTGDVGTLITLAYIAAFLVSFPNGVVADRYGRKVTLVPGMILLGAAGLLFLTIHDFSSGAVAVLIYGVAEGVCFGIAQVYAMDLAPPDRRGAFLGVWTLIMQSGSAASPVFVGFVAQQFGFGPVFVGVAILLTCMSLTMAFFGPDTRDRRGVRESFHSAGGRT